MQLTATMVLNRLVSVLLWQADPAGHGIMLTGRWSEYTGQTWEETQNWGWRSAIHPEDLPRVQGLFTQAFATGTAIELEQRIRAVD